MVVRLAANALLNLCTHAHGDYVRSPLSAGDRDSAATGFVGLSGVLL